MVTTAVGCKGIISGSDLLTAGSGKLLCMTGPTIERLDSGAARERVDQKGSSAAALNRRCESIM